jgi:fructokinase
MAFGCIEAGGTKFVCGVGDGPEDLVTTTLPTGEPEQTVERAVAFLCARAGDELQAVGIGSFGPVDLDPSSKTFGYITSTPKPAWRNFDLAGAVSGRVRLPVGIDTDVNAAALGEARWGAAQGLRDFLYLTVGTGIGGGAISGGRVVHGLVHPEMGHVRLPHDRARDPFAGVCPFHGDCLEGLASGPSLEARWGKAAAEIPEGHPAWELEAHYLALGLANWVCTLSPRRIVMGGGVMQQAHLFPLIRKEMARILNGYIQSPALAEGLDEYVTPPKLGNRSGVLGAMVLAMEAV